jgi:hypothetical protein
MTITVGVLVLVILVALGSRATFTNSSMVKIPLIISGTLDIGMKLDDVSGAPEPGLLQSDITWMPGEHREALLTIENRGNMDGHWRLGIEAREGNSSALLDEMILSVYRPDGKGQWEIVRSEPLAKYLISTGNQAWIYDWQLTPSGSPAVLKAGEKTQMVLQFDFELSAMSPTQNGVFNGDLKLEGAQLGKSDWEIQQHMSLQVEGGEV